MTERTLVRKKILKLVVTPKVILMANYLNKRFILGIFWRSREALVFLLTLFVLLVYAYYFTNYTWSTVNNISKKEEKNNTVHSVSGVGEQVLIAQDDKRVLDFIWKNKLLEPPSLNGYSLVGNEEDTSRGQGQFIRKILNNMEGGVFVEAGALDGETRSNTLYMEKELGWTGLLVEGDPLNYAKIKTKNRRAWTSNTCLATKPYPHKARYLQNFNVGKIVDNEKVSKNARTVWVQCMPLFSLLSALNFTTVDYFSLDVEGSELKVLKTIPFDKVFIKTLSVEFIHTKEGKQGILSFMEKQGYQVAGYIGPPKYSWADDVILVHNSINFKI